VRAGILAPTPPCVDLVTEDAFEDFMLHVEFRYPAGSNSGVYLRGRYEVQIQDVIDARDRFDRIVDRQRFILETIEKQQKLTPELKERLLGCFDPRALEDLYLPFKAKKKSKAEKGREAGLQPLADWVWNCGHGTEQPQPGQTLELWAFTFRNEEKGVKDVEAVLEGTHDILTERLAENADLLGFPVLPASRPA